MLVMFGIQLSSRSRSYVKRNGTVVVWGQNAAGFLAPPSGLDDVVTIAAGDDFTLALLNAFSINDLIALVSGLNIHHGSTTQSVIGSSPEWWLVDR
jgi:hypothetical protein